MTGTPTLRKREMTASGARWQNSTVSMARAGKGSSTPYRLAQLLIGEPGDSCEQVLTLCVELSEQELGFHGSFDTLEGVAEAISVRPVAL